MSFGFVTVGQCLESLPTGRFVWEVIFCAFLAGFFLGAVNESAPPLLLEAPAQQNHAAAAVLLGGLIGNLAGLIADTTGRSTILHPALLLSICCGLIMQLPETVAQLVFSHFLLGLVSACLQTVMLPLVAELLPLQHRSFYLILCCAGFPAGALSALIASRWSMSWQSLNVVAILPVALLYSCTRVGMLPESPRFLYVIGEKEEGYNCLLDIYEKNDMLLPWAAEAVSVKAELEAGGTLKAPSDSSIKAWLAVSYFSMAFLSQCLMAWFPILLIADEPDFIARHEVAGLSHAHAGHVGSLSAVMQMEPNFRVAAATIMCYLMQLLSVIAAAYLSTYVSRRHMVLATMLLLPVLAASTALASTSGCYVLSIILISCILAALASLLHVLSVFACEHFATASRASTMALTVLAGQLASCAPLLVSGSRHVLSESMIASALVFLYILGLLAAFRLPWPSSKSRPLRDLDEVRRHNGCKEWVTYQTI